MLVIDQPVECRCRWIDPGEMGNRPECPIGRDQGLSTLIESDGREYRVERSQVRMALVES